jgi:hypothetical protein
MQLFFWFKSTINMVLSFFVIKTQTLLQNASLMNKCDKNEFFFAAKGPDHTSILTFI